jgi:hypothetical protein
MARWEYRSIVRGTEYLINVIVPSTLADGDHPLTMLYGLQATQAGVLITTKK